MLAKSISCVAQQLLRRARLEEQLSVTVEEPRAAHAAKLSRWQEVKQQNLRGGLVAVSALHAAEAESKSHEQPSVPGMPQVCLEFRVVEAQQSIPRLL